MALRAICDIEITTIADDLPKIISIGLGDTNPYVRRMAVLATVHLQQVAPQAVEEKGMVNRLYELLRDRDPQIVSNSLFALSAVLKDKGGIAFDTNLIHHLVNSLPKFSEWAQSEAMQVISQYTPDTDKERFDLMNIIDQFLQSSSSAVLTGATKILLSLTNDKTNLQKQVTSRVIPKFITHIYSNTPEVQFSLLKHLIVLARRFPECFKPHIPHFFVLFSDDGPVARAKFELLQLITPQNFVREVIETTARYVLIEKPFTIEPGIKLMRDLALQLPQAVPVVISKFRLFFDMKRHHLVNQCLVVLPDLMRRLPASLSDFINLLPTQPPRELSGPALGAYAWILGEYGDRLEDAVYCLESLMLRSWDSQKQGDAVATTLGQTADKDTTPSAQDDVSTMKICIITALAKLLFVNAGQARVVLAQAIGRGLKDQHPAVAARARFIYKLLQANIDAARSALVNNKTSDQPFVEDADSENIDMVFDEFNTFSVIYEEPRADWDTPEEQIDIEIEEEEEEEAAEHKLEELQEITPQQFQQLWQTEGIASISDGVELGYELELKDFVAAIMKANVGVMASGATPQGSKIFAYGYIEGNIALIECLEKEGSMSFTVKAETDEIATQFKDFWLGFFNE